MSTTDAAATAPDEAIITCVVGTWSVDIHSDGQCLIIDGTGREVHHSNCHQSTAIHFAVLLQDRRELRQDLERRIEQHEFAAQPWRHGSVRQRQQMELENAAPYVAWKAAKELRDLLKMA